MVPKLVFVVLALVMTACAGLPEKTIEDYHLADRAHLYDKSHWFFEGRLAVTDDKNSISAALNWRHQQDQEIIELVGPLAQGRVVIWLKPDRVLIDDGQARKEFIGDVEAIVSEQLGVDVPVGSMRYWVLGLNDPNQRYVEQLDGFYQTGWLVRFKEMQNLDGNILPRKMIVEKDKTRIKLIVDQWDLS